ILDDFVAYSKETGAPVWAYVSDNWLARWPAPNPQWLALHNLRHWGAPKTRLAARVVSKLLTTFGWLPDPLPPLDGYFYCRTYIARLSTDNSVGIAEHAVVHWGLPRVEGLPHVAADHFYGTAPLTLLFAGQLLDHKGLHVVLQAMPLCRREHRLVVIGDDSTD